MMRGRRKLPFGRTPVGRIAKPGPETNPWYWHPYRSGARPAPDWFVRKLHAIDPDLSVAWNPILERWQVWERKLSMQNPLSQGWRLLFIHQTPDRQYLPLDERLFARLYAASARVWGNARDYWRAVEREVERDREYQERQFTQDSVDRAMDVFHHSQISNLGAGNKFATYHA